MMINKYRVIYYLSSSGENPVRNFLDSLQQFQKIKVFRLFQMYQEYGLRSIIPHTRKINSTPLWEIRILGKDNIRIFYVTPTGKYILVLHGFTKKKQRTPQKDISIALTRYLEWKMRG